MTECLYPVFCFSDPLHPPAKESGGPQQELWPTGGRAEDQGSWERGPIPGGRLFHWTIPQSRGPQGAGWSATLQETAGQPPCFQVSELYWSHGIRLASKPTHIKTKRVNVVQAHRTVSTSGKAFLQVSIFRCVQMQSCTTSLLRAQARAFVPHSQLLKMCALVRLTFEARME